MTSGDVRNSPPVAWCVPPLKSGGTQILKLLKRKGEPEKKFGVGETKRGGYCQKEREEPNFSSQI